MKKLGLIFVFALAVTPLCAQEAQSQDDYYTGYEGLVLGERTPRSATDAIAQQATQVPGDIYRGVLFGAEQKKYEGDTLGNRPRPKTKFVYDTSLVRAVKMSDEDRVRTLMYANVNVNEKNYAGITPLTIAAEKGNMNIIKMLVEDGALVNDKSSYGVTPLIAAAAAGNTEVVEYLVAEGADVTAKDDWGKTALIYASSTDNPQLITNLIKLDKTAVSLPDNSGNTPIIFAAQQGLNDNIKILLENGADVNYRNPSTGLSAIAAAAAEGHTDTIRLLARTGKADVNIADLSGRTPIFYAVEQDQPEALRMLFTLGADPNAQDNQGVTALMRASAKGRQDCVDILLRQKNIKTDTKDFQDRTALTYSVYADELGPARALVKAGADVNGRDKSGNTPLMSAVKAKSDRMALYFIQQGADLTPVNNAGDNVFTLTDEYLPKSMTANVLGVKKASLYEQALQVQAQKQAEVEQLEQQLAEEEALAKQLQQQAEEANRSPEEIELRAKLEQEYQAQVADDPELIRLQQQLEAAKAQKEAAMQEAIDRKVAEQLGQKETAAPAEPSVLAEEKAAQEAEPAKK